MDNNMDNNNMDNDCCIYDNINDNIDYYHYAIG